MGKAWRGIVGRSRQPGTGKGGVDVIAMHKGYDFTSQVSNSMVGVKSLSLMLWNVAPVGSDCNAVQEGHVREEGAFELCS
jgi:hypothetical protein